MFQLTVLTPSVICGNYHQLLPSDRSLAQSYKTFAPPHQHASATCCISALY